MEQDDVIEVYQEQTGGGEEETVRLVIHGILPNQMTVRVKTGTSFTKVKELFSARSGTPTNRIRFSHEKTVIDDWQTVAELGMEEEVVIRATRINASGVNKEEKRILAAAARRAAV